MQKQMQKQKQKQKQNQSRKKKQKKKLTQNRRCCGSAYRSETWSIGEFASPNGPTSQDLSVRQGGGDG